MILTVFPVLYLIFTFFGARFAGKGEFSKDYISRDQSKLIQASACVGIVLHHLTQQITGYGVVNKGPITIFNHIGFLFTALFFFFSGYGLIVSYNTKPDYLRGFLGKRLPTVLIPFWVINLLGVVLCGAILGKHYTTGEVISDITGLTLVNSNGWFIIEIVILYLAFYVFFDLIKNKDVALTLLCMFTILIIIYSFFQGHDLPGDKSHWFKGEWWYNSTVTFIFGMLYARFKDKITGFSHRHYRLLLMLFSVMCVITVFLSVVAVQRYGYYHEHVSFKIKYDEAVTLLSQSVACIVTTMLVLLMNMKLTLGNRALKYISGISMELFLIHGYFVTKIFGGIRMRDTVRLTAVIVCSIVCTAILSPGIQWLVKHLIMLLAKKKVYHDTLEGRIAEENRRKRADIVRKAVMVLMILAVLGVLYFSFGRYFLAGKEYRDECAAIREADIGDKVLWGHYNTVNTFPGKERLSWIVIAKEDDKVCLISEKGIAGSSYNRTHREVSWEDSDIRVLLNSNIYTAMFSRYEIAAVIPMDGDIISLLTVRQAKELFADDEARELAITDAARVSGVNENYLSKDNNWDMKGYRSSWWWLRGESGVKSYTAPVVTVDGYISPDEKEVNRPNGAIRPVIWVDPYITD